MRNDLRRSIPAMALLLALLPTKGFSQASAEPLAAPTPDHDQPIVLPGKRLPRLLGKAPQRIIAFAWRQGAWAKIPVQIDERVRVSFGQVLQRSSYDEEQQLFYADANTHTGADTDPGFDADDELVLMARDFGSHNAAPTNPKGTTGRAVELELAGPTLAFAYLFLGAEGVDQAAGVDRVRYRLELQRGDYKSHYRLRNGNNPEHSTITTAGYRLGFGDRWVMHELRVTVGEANGADLLDRHKVQVIPGSCVRTTKTFCDGHGAMVANIDGPLRAIRAVVGANSGPLTERLWICYADRFDVITHLRVHPLPSMFMFFDYSPDARDMRYHDNNNPKGFVIDGKPDPCKTGKLDWQFLTGEQGSLEIHYLLQTSIKRLKLSSLYDDSQQPKWKQCTGDNLALAAAGPMLGRLPNTDPRRRGAATLASTIVVYPGAPNRRLEVDRMRAPRPLEVTIR